MIWLLLNQDCVTVYNFINDLRTNDLNEHFSIFKFCDEDTNKLIDKFFKLAKERIFKLVRKD